MQYSTSIAVLALAASATASTIKVAVGQNGLTYTPNNFAARVGDLVEFSFFPKNHTVTQSSFSDPCHPLKSSAGGIFSGFVPTAAPGPNKNTFTIKITDQKPIWLYCGQTVGNHCQSGMLAAINAPTSGPKTFEAYALLAKNASISTSPEGRVKGGVFGPAGAAGNATYTSAIVTVTSDVETQTTALYTDASTTYTTTYATSYPTTLTTASTWPVQASGTGSSGSGSGNGGNGGTSATPSASATFVPGSGASDVTAQVGIMGAAALGAAWALL